MMHENPYQADWIKNMKMYTILLYSWYFLLLLTA